MEHRLAVILCADVVGYSRLKGADEEGTLAALKQIRRGLVDPPISAGPGEAIAGSDPRQSSAAPRPSPPLGSHALGGSRQNTF
jgi:hypothetical protein